MVAALVISISLVLRLLQKNPESTLSNLVGELRMMYVLYVCFMSVCIRFFIVSSLYILCMFCVCKTQKGHGGSSFFPNQN